MAFNPWFIALRAIPWATILAGAPTIVRAADALLSGGKGGASASQLRSLTDRLAALEQHDRADAELLKQIADQVQVLATATAVLAARLRWVLILAIVSFSFAVLALVTAMVRR